MSQCPEILLRKPPRERRRRRAGRRVDPDLRAIAARGAGAGGAGHRAAVRERVADHAAGPAALHRRLGLGQARLNPRNPILQGNKRSTYS